MINLKNFNYCPICGEHRRSICNKDKIKHQFFNYRQGNFYFENKNIIVQFYQDKINFDLFCIEISINFDEKIIEYEKSFDTIEDILNEYNKIIENIIFE